MTKTQISIDLSLSHMIGNQFQNNWLSSPPHQVTQQMQRQSNDNYWRQIYMQ